mgnify:CR=1 FL=1
MPVHPQAQQVLEKGKLLPSLETIGVEAARQRCIEAFCSSEPPVKVKSVQDRILKLDDQLNRQGVKSLSRDLPPDRVPVRLYKPEGPAEMPVLVYFHGGGFVVNDLDTHDGICRRLADKGRCIVISADYARAPEHPYPEAVQQCYAVTSWVAEHAGEFGGDPDRVAVGGDSSGGTLAAGIALMARDLGFPRICFQVLIYPAVNHCTPGTPSYRQFGTGYSLTRPIMEWFYRLYLGDTIDPDAPYLFPLRADDHTSLPPAHIVTAEYDPLRDEGEAYAERLKAAGIPVTEKRYRGMIHGFIVMHRSIDMGVQALSEIGNVLKNKFKAVQS